MREAKKRTLRCNDGDRVYDPRRKTADLVISVRTSLLDVIDTKPQPGFEPAHNR